MKPLHGPLLTALARDYALGTMTGGARRRFEMLLTESAEARAEVANWQTHFATLAAVVPPMAPREQVWQGLTRRLGLQPESPSRSVSAWQRLVGARTLGALAAGALAGVLASTVLLQFNPVWLGHESIRDELPPSYVGLLSDVADQPAVLLSSRRQGRVLIVKMLQPLPPPAGQVGHLWAFPKGGEAPFLVGQLPARGSAALPLSQSAEKLFFSVERLGVTFEAQGSLPTQPSGSLVATGPCVKLW